MLLRFEPMVHAPVGRHQTAEFANVVLALTKTLDDDGVPRCRRLRLRHEHFVLILSPRLPYSVIAAASTPTTSCTPLAHNNRRHTCSRCARVIVSPFGIHRRRNLSENANLGGGGDTIERTLARVFGCITVYSIHFILLLQQ